MQKQVHKKFQYSTTVLTQYGSSTKDQLKVSDLFRSEFQFDLVRQFRVPYFIQSFQGLEQLKQCQKLDISFVKLKSLPICYLSAKSLRDLDLSYTSLDSFAFLSNLENLQSLTLIKSNFYGKDVEYLSDLRLKTLDVRFCEIIEIFLGSRSLESLLIDGTKIRSLFGFRGARFSLRRFSGNQFLSVNQLQHFRNLENISNVSLENCSDLSCFPHLTSLSLVNQLFKRFPKLPDAITDIALERCQVNNFSQLLFLRNYPGLRGLSLLRNPIREISNFQQRIISLLPSLISVDGYELDEIDEIFAGRNVLARLTSIETAKLIV